MRRFLIFFIFVLSSNASAQWSDNPVENTFISFAESVGKTEFKAISDGKGGTFVLVNIIDDLLNSVLYLEKLDKFGNKITSMPLNFTNSELFPVVDEISIAQAANGGAFVVYDERRGLSPNYSHHIFVHKIDSSASKLLGDSGLEIISSSSELILKTVSSDEDGGIIIAWRDDAIMRAQRIDSEGTMLWGINGIAVTSNLATETGAGSDVHSFYAHNSFYISYADEADSEARRVQKIDNLGMLMWGTGVEVSVSDNLLNDGIDGVVTGGSFRQITGTDTMYSVVAHRIDSDGNKKWGANGTVVSGNATKETRNVEIASNSLDEYILVWQSAHTGNSNIYAQKLLFDGQVMWTNGDVAVGDPSVNNFIAAENGSVTDGNLNTIFLWRTDQNQRKGIFGQMIDKDGEKSWSSPEVTLSDRNSGTISSEPQAVSDNNGGLIGIWFETAFEALWAQRANRLGVLGNQLIVSAKDQDTPKLPQSYQLLSNFPNPFNPLTKIRYYVPKTSRITLTIYNILGKEVITLVKARQFQGNYEVEWNGKNSRGGDVASGIYIYELKSENFRITKKLTLIK